MIATAAVRRVGARSFRRENGGWVMALPVWAWPAAKTAATWLVTNGPSVIALAKKYVPPAYRGYQKHGLKPLKIVSSVQSELSNGKAGEVASKLVRNALP